jgi:hypothetical protein
METMHAAGRRKLPPVPRPAADAEATARPAEVSEESPAERTLELGRRAPEETQVDDTPARDTPVDDTPVDDTPVDDTQAPDVPADDPADPSVDPERLAAADEPEYALDDDDPAQDFVSRLRAAAGGFASAAGADTAVVREAVPPARHRRSRCRVVLRYADGGEADLTFLGAVGRPGTPAWHGFDVQIQRWLGTGQQREAAWLVRDAEAPDGIAVDVPAWLAAG